MHGRPRRLRRALTGDPDHDDGANHDHSASCRNHDQYHNGTSPLAQAVLSETRYQPPAHAGGVAWRMGSEAE